MGNKNQSDFQFKYVINQEKLGEGGQGSAYMVTLSTQKFKKFVMKSIKLGSNEKDIDKQTKKEINLMIHLQHKHVIQYFGSDYDKKKKEMYIFM